ncbi:MULTISPECIES: hypothetical protein [unclassified Streptomyces]|uniref:hypothetical protein n=1 Tax=unclassified Streptomyces TaxID=2593676 RepID=UPI0022501714|nr:MULTISPECIES: hypothetical protein [unclassified Streptomyces]MCX5334492.1 hypothetical protein [Streptomyces sp. NBC_00140]MCX5364001.1 hypothetical protein [Streptomyces sp. NBC_00124]
MIRSAEEFIALRYSDDLDEQRRASWESASWEVWTELIESHPDARFWVAHNKTVPLEILRVLASDPDSAVRHMVAMKRKLTADILEGLAADSDESVRLQVARHRRTPRSVLERLLADDWSEVRELARGRIENDDRSTSSG